MNKEKDQSKTKVKTPTPPQDMDPSKKPHTGKEVLGDEKKGNNEKKKKD